MKCLERNKVTFFYALFLRREEILNSQGLKTGKYRNVYTVPERFRANISVPSGKAQISPFGVYCEYDAVIVTDDMCCPIDETTVLCIDREPSYDADGNLLFDYIVEKKAKGLNSVLYAVKRAGAR